MPTLAELRAQLEAESHAVNAAASSALARELGRRAGDQVPQSHHHHLVYASATPAQRDAIDAVFRFFGNGAAIATPEGIRKIAQQELGVELTERQLAEALAEVQSGATAGVSVKEFAAFWVKSKCAAAVTLRAAYTVKQAKTAWSTGDSAQRDFGGAPSRPAEVWTPMTSFRLNATVGGGGAETFKPKSDVKLVVLPSTATALEDAIDDARDAVKAYSALPEDDPDSADARVAAENILGLASIRLPIGADASDEAISECVELLRAAADEFNAQDDFPVEIHATVVRDDHSSNERSFVIYIYIRSAFVTEKKTPLLAVLGARMVAHLTGIASADEPLLDRIMLAVETDADAGAILSPLSPHPVLALAASLRMVLDARVSDRLVDLLDVGRVLECQSELNSSRLQRNAKKLVGASVLLRLLHGVSATVHFDAMLDMLDALLDDFVDAQVRRAVESGTTDAAKVAEIRRQAQAGAASLRAHLAMKLPTDLRAADVLGYSKLRRVFGELPDLLRVTVVGGSAWQRAAVLRQLEAPLTSTPADERAAADDALVARFLEGTGPFILTKSGESNSSHACNSDCIAMHFSDEQLHRAAATASNVVIAIVDTTSEETVAHDAATFRAFARHAGDGFDDMSVVVVAASAKPAPAAVTLARANVEKLRSEEEKPAVFVELPFGGAVDSAAWEPVQRAVLDARRLQKASASGDDDDDDEPGEGTTKEIVQSILFAFRQHVSSIAELSFTFREFQGVARFGNLPLLAVLPASREELATARAAATTSLRSQTKAKGTDQGFEPEDQSSLRESSSMYANDFAGKQKMHMKKGARSSSGGTSSSSSNSRADSESD